MIGNSIRIPVLNAQAVSIHLSPLPRTGDFSPETWPQIPLTRDPSPPEDGEWWQITFPVPALTDGVYEYDFRIQRAGQSDIFAPDPYAEEITRFGGYRSILRLQGGLPVRLPFDWTGELTDDHPLANNNQIIIYELPMRWVDSSDEAIQRQVGLGTFDKTIFERLSCMAGLGINAIELLPIQDSRDTLNWGYGTRFFFAPDLDMGQPADLKLFIKKCHQRGIRVILDVVMNHSKACPLETLAFDMFYLRSADEERVDGQPRNGWGGQLFRYAQTRYGAFHARNFHYGMAEFWIREYRIDGFRIDEFHGINNWDFIREFHDRAWQIQQASFPGRPFIVIAEDSGRHPEISYDRGGTPDERRVVDAIWDFDFRDELRRLLTDNAITTENGHTPSERTWALIAGNRLWDDLSKNWRQGILPGGGSDTVHFTDMAQRIAYNTSHDVAGQTEQRLLPYFVEVLKNTWNEWHTTSIDNLVFLAFDLVHASFALMLTTVGIPMFLAGEEFGDLHDLPHEDWRQKMSDPVDWERASLPGHSELLTRVRDLIHLRQTHPALHRNEVAPFGLPGGFHPQFDTASGPHVFAYCRTAGQPLGSDEQVIVVANCGANDFPNFWLDWPWASTPVNEVGGRSGQSALSLNATKTHANVALRPFQIRVFST